MNNMESSERMSILLVTGNRQAAATIKNLLESPKYEIRDCVLSSSIARRLLLEKDYDIIMINCPLPDETGTSFACHAADTTSSGIVLFIDAESYDNACLRCEPYGIMTVSKPFTKTVFHQIMVLLSATKRRLFTLEKENSKLSRRMEEIKTVSEAKYLLMERKNMSEDEAHKYIEKMSMNQRVTKTEMAKSIIRMYK